MSKCDIWIKFCFTNYWCLHRFSIQMCTGDICHTIGWLANLNIFGINAFWNLYIFLNYTGKCEQIM